MSQRYQYILQRQQFKADASVTNPYAEVMVNGGNFKMEVNFGIPDLEEIMSAYHMDPEEDVKDIVHRLSVKSQMSAAFPGAPLEAPSNQNTIEAAEFQVEEIMDRNKVNTSVRLPEVHHLKTFSVEE